MILPRVSSLVVWDLGVSIPAPKAQGLTFEASGVVLRSFPVAMNNIFSSVQSLSHVQLFATT